MSLERPPNDTLSQIADVIGVDGARLLAQHLGGTSIYVPRAIGENHVLRAVLGNEMARTFANFYGGAKLDIPKRAHRRARVQELARNGTLTKAAIAIETGYSERQVYRLIAEDAAERQGDLFQ